MLKQRQEHFCSLTSHSVLLVRRAEGAGRGQLTYNGQRGIPYHMASMQKESLQQGEFTGWPATVGALVGKW